MFSDKFGMWQDESVCCPACGSDNVNWDELFAFWECTDCGERWEDDER